MSRQKWIIGIDLNMKKPEICYFERETRASGVTPMKIGNARVNLTELFEKADHISEKAAARTIADILKEVFKTFGIEDIQREIAGIMITVPELTRQLTGLIKRVYELLGIARSQSYLQDYKESLYYYMAYQKKELWNRNVALFQFDGNDVSCSRLAVNQVARPRTARVIEMGKADLPEEAAARDARFDAFAAQCLKNELYSSIFISGEGFSVDWARQSRKRLGQGGRKVYTEEHLYARGACNSVREKIDEKRISGFIYLGDSLVQYNVGMNLLVREKLSYYPLITAGVHWYNANCDCEFFLGDSDSITFILSSMENGGRYLTTMKLDGLPERPPRTTRLRLHMEYEEQNKCIIEVEDLGFGDLFPSSGKIWHEVLGEIR
ncbi:MAG: hypothetical protein IJ860_09570 [Eubacterium sp.]|nr:hypothetical protein [Eubacterium sp.]